MAKKTSASIAIPSNVSASSNWKQLKRALHPSSPSKEAPASKKRSRSDSETSIRTIVALPDPVKSSIKGKERASEELQREEFAKKEKTAKGLVPIDDLLNGRVASWQMDVGQYLAIDCEMVGVGPEGVESTLARVSIVNYHGAVMLDSFVRPREKVTDYRTWVSGVREEDLIKAPTFAEVIKKVSELIKDRILIGHAISNDTQVLLLSHPHHLTRDTAKYQPLQALARTKRPGLKTLAKLVLGVDIQAGEHSSIDDARATMAIYRSQKSAWEDSIRTKAKPKFVYSTTEALKQLEKEGGIETLGRSAGNGNGVKKNMGIAQTLRLVRAQKEEENWLSRQGDEAEEELVMEERQKKKLRRDNDDDDLVLGFDFKPAPTVTATTVVSNSISNNKRHADDVASKIVKRVKKPFSSSKKGSGVDSEKRPKSKEGWWEED